MPPPATRPKLRKREIVLAVGAGVLAAGIAAGILSDGDGSSRVIVAAEEGEKTYEVANFERISTTGPQDVEIRFGDTYSARAEGAIGSLEVVVENGELIIRPAEGFWNWPGLTSTTLYVTVPKLSRLYLNGTGDVSVDQLKGERFTGVLEGFAGDFKLEGMDVGEAEFTINGPGDITASGVAGTTRVTIEGPGEFKAADLQTQRAVVVVRGPGDVQLTAQEEADVTVEGPGEVDIDGTATCTVSRSGPGSVSCGDQDYD